MATDMTVAQTILQQLGGRRFIAMTGSRNFVGSADSLSFKVGSNPNKVTHVRVTLTPMDTYTVAALKIRKFEVQTVAETEDVYCDNLQEVFTSITGLYTRL